MMQPSTQRNFPNTPLSRERSANTLRLRVLMEQQQRMEIGQRIRGLREASPQTNSSIADYVGVGERSVANWISGSTGITYKHAKKVAELFDVDVRWLWDGKERSEPDASTPPNDLLDALGDAATAKRIESALEDLAAGQAELLEKLDGLLGAQAPGSKRKKGAG